MTDMAGKQQYLALAALETFKLRESSLSLPSHGELKLIINVFVVFKLSYTVLTLQVIHFDELLLITSKDVVKDLRKPEASYDQWPRFLIRFCVSESPPTILH